MSKKLSFLLGFSLYIPYRFLGDRAGAISFTPTDLVVLLYLIYIIIKMLASKSIKLDVDFILKFKFVFFMTVIIFLINYIASEQSTYYTSMTKELILAFILYIILNIDVFLFKSDIKKYILYGFLFSGLSNSLLSIAQNFTENLYIQKSNVLSYKVNLYGEVINNPIIGFFAHTNSNAYMIILCLIVCMYIFKNKLVKFICISINIIALYGTQSKGAFILCIIIVCSYFILRNRKRLVLKYKLITIFSILQIYLLYLMSLIKNIPELGTFKDRILFQYSFIKLISENPIILIIGNGTSKMELYTAKYARYSLIYAHASFLDNILLLGIVGVIINYLIFNRYFRLVKISDKLKNLDLLIMLILMILTMIYVSFIEPIYMTQPVTYILAILLFNAEQVFSNNKKQKECIKYENIIFNTKQ